MTKLLGGSTKTKFVSDSATSYIIMQGDDKASNDIASMLVGMAPANKIVIEQGVDASYGKALKKSLIVSTFGEMPVTITLLGVDILSCFNKEAEEQPITAQDVFDAYNADKYKTPIELGIVSGKSTKTFRCVLTSLTRTHAPGDYNGNRSLDSYVMKFIGVSK